MVFKHNYTDLNADLLIEALVVVSFDPPVVVPTTPMPPSNGTTPTTPAPANGKNDFFFLLLNLFFNFFYTFFFLIIFNYLSMTYRIIKNNSVLMIPYTGKHRYYTYISGSAII